MVPSVSELRQRIDALLKSRAQQKEILRDLDQRLSATRSQLNSALDPITRLPPEISSEIFIQCLPAAPTWSALWTLMCVSHAWRTIALGTGRLWMDMSDAGVPAVNFHQFLDIWVGHWSNSTIPFSLSIRVENMEPFCFMDGPRRWSLFHALTSLTIRDLDDTSISFQLCHRILGGAPNLLEFTNIRSTFSECVPEALTHPKLRVLSLGHPANGDSRGRHHFLRHVTLPCLQILNVPGGKSYIEGVQRFLERSSPPLLQFQISLGRVKYDELAALFQLVPGLTDLNILLPLPGWNNPVRFLDLFALHPHLLPALRNLVVYEAGRDEDRHRRVLDFVIARQTTLKSLRVVVRRSPTVNNVDARFALACREFASRGIVISIEHEEGINRVPRVSSFSSRRDP